eukprot:SAG11_NODE_5702_length_1483_cov_1.442197_2_plen_140_part_00
MEITKDRLKKSPGRRGKDLNSFPLFCFLGSVAPETLPRSSSALGVRLGVIGRSKSQPADRRRRRSVSFEVSSGVPAELPPPSPRALGSEDDITQNGPVPAERDYNLCDLAPPPNPFLFFPFLPTPPLWGGGGGGGRGGG